MNWVTERRGFGRCASVRNLSNLQLSGVPCEFIGGIRRIRTAALPPAARARAPRFMQFPGRKGKKKKKKGKKRKREREREKKRDEM